MARTHSEAKLVETSAAIDAFLMDDFKLCGK